MTAETRPSTTQPAAHAAAVRSWPARAAGRGAVVPVAALAAACWLASASTGSRLFGLGTALVLLAATWRYWLPVDFELDYSGIVQQVGRRRWRIPWGSIGGYAVLPTSVRVWPAGVGRMTAALRAISIPLDGQREAVLALLAEHVGPPEEGQGV
jgi:hypothetical protein